MRRSDDRNRIVIFDRFKPSLFNGIIIVLGLSILDAILTLILLSQGAKELNPVMRYYLNRGSQVFIFVKQGLTVLPMLIILLANEVLTNRYRIGAGMFFHIFAAFFGGVVIWEFYLLTVQRCKKVPLYSENYMPSGSGNGSSTLIRTLKGTSLVNGKC